MSRVITLGVLAGLNGLTVPALLVWLAWRSFGWTAALASAVLVVTTYAIGAGLGKVVARAEAIQLANGGELL